MRSLPVRRDGDGLERGLEATQVEPFSSAITASACLRRTEPTAPPSQLALGAGERSQPAKARGGLAALGSIARSKLLQKSLRLDAQLGEAIQAIGGSHPVPLGSAAQPDDSAATRESR